MNKQLSEAQIESLHMFCAKHYVPYYDVQVELVDHMASAIETRWLTEPNVGFEEALNDVYRTFGVGGFSKVRMEKEKELRQKYSRLQRNYIGEFFRLPKIILTVAVVLLFYVVLWYSGDSISVYSRVVRYYVVFAICYLFIVYPIKYRIKFEFGKKLLLRNQLPMLKRNSINFLLIPMILFHIGMFWLLRHAVPTSVVEIVLIDFLLAFLLTLFGISLVVVLNFVPNRIKDEIFRLYPNIIVS
jgi:hypothetical protein